MQDALAQAGVGGTVILQSGYHFESETIVIDHSVDIVGEEGAVIEASTVAHDDIAPALHISNTSDVLVEGVTLLQAPGNAGNVGILVQNAPDVTLRENGLAGFEVGVFVQNGPRIDISDNTIVDMDRFGILHLNGLHASITNNTVDSVGIHGIWLGDEKGQCRGNTVSNAIAGILLCHLIEGPNLPDGTKSGAAQPATDWHVAGNECHDNVLGILVTDGATSNLLNNNDVWASTEVDILLEGDFVDVDGTYDPAAIGNTVVIGSHKNLSVWDFGFDNTVKGLKK
ncbi:MAG: right-handed parallel beta-helix repeat-containing protein [Verrucomicrobiales bacterium]